MFHLVIPGEPKAWKRALDARGGGRVNPRDMRDDQKHIAQLGCDLVKGQPPLFGPVKVYLLCVFDIPASWSKQQREKARAAEVYRDIDPDADRLLNQVLDALKFVAYVDDCQVADCRSVMRYGWPARRELWLTPLEAGNKTALKRREETWTLGGYNKAIAKAPCGIARWPQVVRADAKDQLL